MRALVSGLVGAVLGGILVTGGVTIYNASTTTDQQKADPAAVGYADE